MNSVKINGLNVTCRRSDGSIVPVNEIGEYDPPLKMPRDIHIAITRLLNPGVEIIFKGDK